MVYRKTARGKQQETDVLVQLLTEIKSCAARRDIQWGKRIHSKVVELRNHSNKHVAAALITMYAKCGSMVEARRVFRTIGQPDVESWNALVIGYAENGDAHFALDLFSRMKARGCSPTSVTYMAALTACMSLAENVDLSEKQDCLEKGRDLHFEIGCHLNRDLQGALVAMYAKCGSMADAQRVFDSIVKPDVASWNALLLGYVESGEGSMALCVFSKMEQCGCMPDSTTYVYALKACVFLAANGDDREKNECLQRGKKMHSKLGGHLNHDVQNMLIKMYAACGSMDDARRVFESMQPDERSHNALHILENVFPTQ